MVCCWEEVLCVVWGGVWWSWGKAEDEDEHEVDACVDLALVEVSNALVALGSNSSSIFYHSKRRSIRMAYQRITKRRRNECSIFVYVAYLGSILALAMDGSCRQVKSTEQVGRQVFPTSFAVKGSPNVRNVDSIFPCCTAQVVYLNRISMFRCVSALQCTLALLCTCGSMRAVCTLFPESAYRHLFQHHPIMRSDGTV